MTARRMISGLVLKYRKGERLVLGEGYRTAPPRRKAGMVERQLLQFMYTGA